MIQQPQAIFLAENEKSFVITKPKVASRFVQSLYQGSTHEIRIENTLEISPYFEVTNEASKSYNRLLDVKTNNKEIFLIYRNPLKRYISGVIEDILVSIGQENFNERFFLRSYLSKNNIEPYYLFEQLKENESNRNFLLNEEFKSFLDDVLNDFFYWQVQTTPIFSHHSSPYMVIYDKILKSQKIDNRKVHLINLDNEKNNLSEILKPFVSDATHIETSEQISSKQSHKVFYSYVNNMIENNVFFKDLVDNVCSLDFYFYDEFEKSPLNVLNSEIRN